MAKTTSKKTSKAAQAKDLASFAEAISERNPFAINRVSDPAQMEWDVASIHQRQFDTLVQLAKDVCHSKRAQGTLLLGSAGVGKSHLLARFSKWAAKDERACYVFLHNIQVDPDGIDRYLLKCVVTKLAQDRLFGLSKTPLFNIVQAAIVHAAKEEGLTVLNDKNRQDVFAKLAGRLGGDRDVLDVMFTFFHAASLCADTKKDDAVREKQERRAALAVRWLQGDLLDDDEAKEIGKRVPPNHDVIQLSNHQVQAVILAITRLARVSSRPLILCLDQVDNMQPEQVTALSRSLHSLIDHASNLLVVVSGVQETIYKFIEQGTIAEAAADRLDRHNPIRVGRLTKFEARKILEDRLHHFLVPFEGIEAIKKEFHADSLFPLGEGWFDDRTDGSLDFKARDVLGWARVRWLNIKEKIAAAGAADWLKNWQENPGPSKIERKPTDEEILKAIDEKVAMKFEECISARKIQPGGLPADAANLMGLVHESLKHCLSRGDRYTIQKIDARQKNSDGWDILVHEKYPTQKEHWKNGVMFVTTGSKTSAAAKLKNLAKSKADLRVLVTDHERMPLPVGPVAQQHLTALEALGTFGFRYVKLTFDDYARLDAILAVGGQAKSQDLEVEPLPGHVIQVSEQDVIDAHHRAKRYETHPLLSVFLTQEPKIKVVQPITYPDREKFRDFVRATLALNIGMWLTELLRRRIVEDNAKLEVEHCLEEAKSIAHEMHKEGLVKAQAWENDLFLQIGVMA